MTKNRASNAASSLRSVFSLSAGTLVVQVLSAIGQFALAFWLTPEEFGFWAAAISAMTLLTSLTNFGEVSGYLSGANKSYRQARKRALRANLVLVILGFLLSFAYVMADKNSVAFYCLILALTIPIKGEADLVTAASINYNLFRKIVKAQAIAALLKLGVSVFLAIAFKSAIALAISNSLYSLVLVISLSLAVKNAITAANTPSDTSISFKQRFDWALNSYFMSFPVQAIFLGAQFLLTPSQLGLMFLGFQITIALSSLLSVPLNRVVLSTLSRTSKELRGKLTAQLGCIISICATCVSSLLALSLTLLLDYLPDNWVPAVPIAIAFLVSMPIRILTPILEARQQVAMKWNQATAFNAFESVGSILVIFTFTKFNDIVWLALAISGWKIILGLVRAYIVLRNERALVILTPLISSIFGAIVLYFGFISPIVFNSIFLSIVIVILVIMLLILSFRKKSTRKHTL